jgi:hypothetical protein
VRSLLRTIAGGLIVVFLVIAFLFVADRQENARKTERVVMELCQFRDAMYECQDRNIPPPTSLVEATSTDTIYPSIRIKQGVDPWGSPYFYDVEEIVGKIDIAYSVTLRSFGPNRVDDGGEADDLQNEYLVILFTDR